MENKAEKVHEIMLDSLNDKEEGAIVVKGIMRTFAFNPEKVAAHKAEIRELLADMPDDFQAEKGGGMSFLNLCMDKSGQQWAAHPTMEALVALGEAVGMASYPMPRDLWSVLPGGMPYVAFTIGGGSSN